jgi:aminopeptidase N
VSLPRPLAAGARAGVEVRYSGSPVPVPSPWGGLGWEELTDGALVAGQPIGAPSWFPCNDRPDDKASYRISVTTASPYQVIANGVLVGKRRAGGNTTWIYEQTEPMASYLASVQIGRYQLSDVAGTRLAYPTRLATRVRRDFGRQGEMMELFTDLFGPYPFTGYTVVVADDDLDIPVEAQGMSIFGRNHVDGMRGCERLIAHELAASPWRAGATSGCRRASPPTPSGSGRRRPAARPRAPTPSAGTKGSPCFRRTSSWPIPARPCCSTTASTSGAR